MRFVSILLQWFAKHKPNPDDTETKKAVMKLLLLDNFIIIALSFWLGVRFALSYPDVAEEFVNVFSWLTSWLGI